MAPGDGGIDALVALRDAGTINNVSLGLNNPEYVLRMLRGKPDGTFNSIMSAGAWNLIDQDGRDAQPALVIGQQGLTTIS